MSFVLNTRSVYCVILISIFTFACAKLPDDDVFEKSVKICKYKNDRLDRSRSINQNSYLNCVDALRAIPIAAVSGIDKIDKDRIIFVQIVDGHGISSVSPGVTCLEEEIFKRQYVFISYNVDSSISKRIEDDIASRIFILTSSNKHCTPF